MPRRACGAGATACRRGMPRHAASPFENRTASYLTAALSFEPAVTLTRWPAGILISAPVCGLRPVRADVSTRSNEIQPGIETLLPLATASETVEKRESSTPDTADWLCPVALAMLATSSVLVMDLSAMGIVLQRGLERRPFVAWTGRLMPPGWSDRPPRMYPTSRPIPRISAVFRLSPRRVGPLV